MQKPSTIQRSITVHHRRDEIVRADDRGLVKFVEVEAVLHRASPSAPSFAGSGSLSAFAIKRRARQKSRRQRPASPISTPTGAWTNGSTKLCAERRSGFAVRRKLRAVGLADANDAADDGKHRQHPQRPGHHRRRFVRVPGGFGSSACRETRRRTAGTCRTSSARPRPRRARTADNFSVPAPGARMLSLQ